MKPRSNNRLTNQLLHCFVFCLVLLSLVATPAAASFRYVSTWEQAGKLDFQPGSVAADKRSVYFTSKEQPELGRGLFKFDFDGNFANFTASNIAEPVATGNGLIYTVRGDHEAVKVFNSEGEPVRTFPLLRLDLLKNNPFDVEDIAADSQGNTYVIRIQRLRFYHRSRRVRVEKYNSEGEYEFEIGSYGPDPGQFRSPIGLGINRDSNVYVVDALARDIKQFSPDGELETLLSVESAQGERLGPFDVAFGTGNSMHVVYSKSVEHPSPGVAVYDAERNLIDLYGQEIPAGNLAWRLAVSGSNSYIVIHEFEGLGTKAQHYRDDGISRDPDPYCVNKSCVAGLPRLYSTPLPLS